MENHDDKIISSIIDRLNTIESEISEIKKIYTLSEKNQIPSTQASQIKPVKKTIEKQGKSSKLSSSNLSLESAIGTKWIGRVGMLAIIVGIAFFLKYSFDNKLIGETGRIILGLFWGACFIGAGEYFHQKKHWQIYGQILTGGGLAILYFSIYAAFAFYHLISQILAFVVLVIITTTGITLSTKNSALSIAVIGILGGFLTPIMLSTGENKPIPLFSYILLLDIGIISVIFFKHWRSIGLASLIGTILIYTAWHERFYTSEQQMLAFIIVTVFFLIYSLFVLLLNSKEKSSFDDLVIIVLAAGFYLLAFYAQNQFVNNWNSKSFVIALACIQILFAGIGLKLSHNDKLITYGFAFTSVVVNIIAIFVVFEKEWISAALAVEMVVFTYMGVKLNKYSIRFVSYILGIISIARFLEEIYIHLGPFDQFIVILNSRFFICSFIISAFYSMLVLLSRNKINLRENESIIIPGTLIITQILSVVLLSTEFYDFYRFPSRHTYLTFAEFRYASQLSLSIVWATYASALVSMGIVRKMRLLRMLGIFLIGITIAKVFFFDLSELKTIYRITSFVILGLLLLLVSYFYNRFKHRIFGDD